MYTYWLIPTVIAAGLQWYARWRGHRWLHLITKPAVMLLLLAWVWQSTHFEGFTGWIGLALFFSLLGDILLMLPPSFFMAGLGAFLLGHICFMLGFRVASLSGQPLLWGVGIVLLAMALYTQQYYWKVLKKKLYSKKVRSGVMLYIIIIHGMIFSAVSTFWQPEWSAVTAGLVAVGAVLFGISDSTLAYNRFMKKIPIAHVWIMITYHMAQIAMTLGVVLQYFQTA